MRERGTWSTTFSATKGAYMYAFAIKPQGPKSNIASLSLCSSESWPSIVSLFGP
jgi:hypothetical protein